MKSARSVAAHVIGRVWEDGAFAAAALSNALDDSKMDPRDRGLCTEISYGVLRTQGYLERALGELGKLKLTDRDLMSHLLVGAYQIEFLDRVPAHAAVNEAVRAVSEVRDARVAGFVNALLRRFSERPKEARCTLREAAVQSAPSWLRRRLIRDVGESAAASLLCPGSASARLGEPHSASPDSYLRLIGEEPEWFSQGTSRVAGVPRAYRFDLSGDARKQPGFVEGSFVVQELGAQLVAHAAGVQPGERVLDACAGRGQKTSLFAELVGTEGRVLATDLHEHKVNSARLEMERLGFQTEHRVFDFTCPPEESWLGAFDRVIVDAPCSGVGTLARRPEIARRLTSEDPARLAELQLQILKNAALTVRPGGLLLFATCSVLSVEGEEVVDRLLSHLALGPGPISFSKVAPTTPVDAVLYPDEAAPSACFRLLPETHGTDGYFVARLIRAST